MGGAVIHNPEYPARIAIGLLFHHLGDQAIEGFNAAFAGTMAKDLGAVDIPGSDVRPGTQALVLVFDLRRPMGFGRQTVMPASPGLDAGLFIGRDHEFVVLQGLVLPLTLVEIQDGSSFGGEIRCARKNPTSVLPRADGVLMQPTPEGGITDLCRQTTLTDVLRQFRDGPPGQRYTQGGRQFTSQRFNAHDQFWGEKTGGGPAGGVPPNPPDVPRRTVYARG